MSHSTRCTDFYGSPYRRTSEKRPGQSQYIDYGDIARQSRQNAIADNLALTAGDSPLHRATTGPSGVKVVNYTHKSPADDKRDDKEHMTISVQREDGSGTREWHHLYPNGDSTSYSREGVKTRYPGGVSYSTESIRYEGCVEERWDTPPSGSQQREGKPLKW